MSLLISPWYFTDSVLIVGPCVIINDAAVYPGVEFGTLLPNYFPVFSISGHFIYSMGGSPYSLPGQVYRTWLDWVDSMGRLL